MSATRPAAIVLAADRGPNDPVARATGAPCKALSPVAGTPLIRRCLETLAGMGVFERLLVVGPDAALRASHSELDEAFEATGASWIAPRPSPSASAAHALGLLDDVAPALITTADHALLSAAMVAPLLARAGHADVSVGLTPYAGVRAAYPASRRSRIRLTPGAGFCGCNLFAVHTARGRTLVDRWRAVEAERKHPARMITGMLGWPALARYATRTLSLESAFARLSRRTGIAVEPCVLDIPEAAVDVDSVADLRLAERTLGARG